MRSTRPNLVSSSGGWLSFPTSKSFPPAITRRRFPSRVRPEAEHVSQADGQAENGTWVSETKSHLLSQSTILKSRILVEAGTNTMNDDAHHSVGVLPFFILFVLPSMAERRLLQGCASPSKVCFTRRSMPRDSATGSSSCALLPTPSSVVLPRSIACSPISTTAGSQVLGQLSIIPWRESFGESELEISRGI